MSSGLGNVKGPGLGVVCADFDGDGWPDIFVTNDGKPNHLWINQRDGTFRAVQVDVIPPRVRGRLQARTRNGYYAPGSASSSAAGN